MAAVVVTIVRVGVAGFQRAPRNAGITCNTAAVPVCLGPYLVSHNGAALLDPLGKLGERVRR